MTSVSNAFNHEFFRRRGVSFVVTIFDGSR